MSQPNILMVSIDSLRRDAVSSINELHSITPQLDELASQGALFPNAITPALWTLPAHTSLFTGLYPAEHGVTGGDRRLGDHPTLPELLADSGYDRRAYYRLDWLGAGDVLRGFSSHDTSANTDEITSLAVQNKIADWLDLVSEDLKQAIRGIYRGTFRGPMPDRNVVDSTLDGLTETTEPFFFFVHFNDAHWPYSPTTPYHRQFTDRSWLQLFWNRAYTQRKLYGEEKSDYNLSDEEIQITKELYLGCVRQTDAHLRRIIDGLKEKGLYENTVILIFGDHGEAFGELGYFGHGDYPIPEVANIPLLIHDPTNTIKSGRVNTPVQLNDIYPTVADFIGITPPSTRSKSIISDRRDIAYTHTSMSDSESESPPRYFGVWKTARDFFIWDTIDETIDYVGGDQPDADDLDRHMTELVRVEPLRDSTLDANARANLRQLGYLE